MSELSLPKLEQLLKLDIGEIKAWLQSITSDNSGLPEQFNWWLGLAEGAYARTIQGEPPSLEWAEVAITAYENVNAYSAHGCEACMLSAMNVRAKIISILGTKPADTILDSQIIINWFFEKLPMSRDDAENKIKLSLQELHEHYPKDMLELRNIKNRLNVIMVLHKSGVQIDGELKEWLKMRDKFP